MAEKKSWLILFLLILAGCSTSRKYRHLSECYAVINASLGRIAPRPEIFFKSFVSPEYEVDFIRSRSLILDNVHEEIRNEGIRKIDSVKKGPALPEAGREILVDSIARKYLTPLLADFLSEQEAAGMASDIPNRIRWDQNRLEKGIVLSHSKTGSVKVSTPLFTANHRKAVYFVETESSLQLMLCEKDVAGNWQFYASSTVWIE